MLLAPNLMPRNAWGKVFSPLGSPAKIRENLQPPAAVAYLRSRTTGIPLALTAAQQSALDVAFSHEGIWERDEPRLAVSFAAAGQMSFAAWTAVARALAAIGDRSGAEVALAKADSVVTQLGLYSSGDAASLRGIWSATRASVTQTFEVAGLGDPFDPQRAEGGDNAGESFFEKYAKYMLPAGLTLGGLYVGMPLLRGLRRASEKAGGFVGGDEY